MLTPAQTQHRMQDAVLAWRDCRMAGTVLTWDQHKLQENCADRVSAQARGQ